MRWWTRSEIHSDRFSGLPSSKFILSGVTSDKAWGINLAEILTGSSALSESDLAHWMRALTSLPSQEEDLLIWVDSHLRPFFPFQRLFIAHGELMAGQIRITHCLSMGHEQSYIEQIASTFELKIRTSLAWWLKHRDPIFIDPDAPPFHASEFELREIRDFKLENVAAHGVVSAKGTGGTYFAFCGVRKTLGTEWHQAALRLIAPVMNDVYLKVVAAAQPIIDLECLTLRQLEIVRLVISGMSDKVIARQLGINEKTVRNQLTGIYSKLGIQSRTKLIALVR